MTERTVNARQFGVLRWIVDGCPDGVMEGFTYKSTALALQGRRLVTVTKRRGQWKAEATEAGVYFLKHGAYPSGHWTAGSEPRSSRSAPVRSRPQTRSKVERAVTGLRPVDQMLADLVEAGGELVVQASEHGYWEGLVSSATRYNKVPDGKLLKIERGKTLDKRIIRLADPPEWMTAMVEPVPVKDQLRNPHPAVKALQNDRDHLMLRREVKARALRILDAIANACAARGYEADLPRQRSGHRHVNGHLEVTINGHPD